MEDVFLVTGATRGLGRSIALAIAMRPQILIADEPTTALDVTTQSQILKLLKSLVDEEKMSLILITHDLAVVSGLANNVAVMQKDVMLLIAYLFVFMCFKRNWQMARKWGDGNLAPRDVSTLESLQSMLHLCL